VRKTAFVLVLALTAVALKRTQASRKSIATEARYNDNFTAVWTALNKLTPLTDNVTFLASISQCPGIGGLSGGADLSECIEWINAIITSLDEGNIIAFD
jgi:hypothetical protein